MVKCKMDGCDIELNSEFEDTYCMRCEDMLFDAQCEAHEQREEFDGFDGAEVY